MNRLIKRLDGAIAVSDLTRRRFCAWTGLPQEKIQLLFASYDPQLFYPAPKNQALIERYGLQGKIVLMTMGRLDFSEQYKGFDEILGLLPALTREIPELGYLIVGEGNDRTRLQKKARSLGVADRVVFAGYVDEAEKADHYRIADVYVMPSRGEGFGIVFLEAMACGIPAVGSKLDGSREALAEGRFGILVDPGDREEIIEAIRASLAATRRKRPEGLEEFSLCRFKERSWKIAGSCA